MHGTDTISLLIADDHTLVRQGLRRLLAEDPRLVVVAEAGASPAILPLVRRHGPDVLLLDIDLPGQSGLAVLATLRAHGPHALRTLVLSAFLAEEYVRRAREMGAAGFLSKGCDGARLRQAVHQVMAGVRVLDPAIASILRRQSYNPRGRFRRYTDGSLALSAAECAVLHQLLGEQTYEEIGAALGRSGGTVRTQAAKIYQKLDVCSRQQAVLKALRLGLLQLEEGPSRGGDGRAP